MKEIQRYTATRPDGTKIIQTIYDTGSSFRVTETDTATAAEEAYSESNYLDPEHRFGARAMAVGIANRRHHAMLHDFHGDSFTGKNGLKYWWSEAIGAFVTIPEE